MFFSYFFGPGRKKEKSEKQYPGHFKITLQDDSSSARSETRFSNVIRLCSFLSPYAGNCVPLQIKRDRKCCALRVPRLPSYCSTTASAALLQPELRHLTHTWRRVIHNMIKIASSPAQCAVTSAVGGTPRLRSPQADYRLTSVCYPCNGWISGAERWRTEAWGEMTAT